jgi:hypothetical protein
MNAACKVAQLVDGVAQVFDRLRPHCLGLWRGFLAGSGLGYPLA